MLEGREGGKERNVSGDGVERGITVKRWIVRNEERKMKRRRKKANEQEADVARSRNTVDEVLRILEVVVREIEGGEVPDEDGRGAVRNASAPEGELSDRHLRDVEGEGGSKRVIVEVDALDHRQRLEAVGQRGTTEPVSTQITVSSIAGWC